MTERTGEAISRRHFLKLGLSVAIGAGLGVGLRNWIVDNIEKEQSIDICNFQKILKRFINPNYDTGFWEEISLLKTREDLRRPNSISNKGLGVVYLRTKQEIAQYNDPNKDPSRSGQGVIYRFNLPGNSTIIHDVAVETRNTGYTEVRLQLDRLGKISSWGDSRFSIEQLRIVSQKLLAEQPDMWIVKQKYNFYGTTPVEYITGKLQNNNAVTTLELYSDGHVRVYAVPLVRA